MKSYISKNLLINKKDILNKKSFLPKDYRMIESNNSNFYTINQYIIEEKVGEQINVENYLTFNSDFKLITISNMENLLLDFSKGEWIPPKLYKKSSKKIRKGEFLISRNASLGKISFVNKKCNAILNGGISKLLIDDKKKWYIFAFFISNYGKDYLSLLTSGGGTQQNAKRQNLLDVKIPFPTSYNHDNPNDIELLVSLITQNIIDKEEQINFKREQIDNFIENELKNHQKSNSQQYSYPKLNLLKKEIRLDTGLYEKEYQLNNNLITNYINGYFNIPIEKFKSGSTPKIRIFNGGKLNYNWVTPTDIKDFGFYTPIEKISMPTIYNLTQDAILFINRTSKGKKGEYVGISCFYDYSYYSKGHHNQGIYRVEDFSKLEKLFITTFMNSKIVRKICGRVSIGSKMKEMKSYDFSKLNFPNFPINKQKKVVKHYYNYIDNLNDITFDNYLDKNKKRNNKLGVYQLSIEIFTLKKKLEIIIDKIILNSKINIEEYLLDNNTYHQTGKPVGEVNHYLGSITNLKPAYALLSSLKSPLL